MSSIPKPRFWHQYYPENLPTSLQYEPTTIPQALHRSAQHFADRASLVFYGFR
ncbi:MAG: hypothetical protein HC913_08190 [Microscillaceae bacterium]|nr:hypothetical protein [Microscillaceae bacterium]